MQLQTQQQTQQQPLYATWLLPLAAAPPARRLVQSGAAAARGRRRRRGAGQCVEPHRPVLQRPPKVGQGGTVLFTGAHVQDSLRASVFDIVHVANRAVARHPVPCDRNRQARNSGMLVACFYALDDFAGLVKLADALPEVSPLLGDIGAKLQSVGLCSDAVATFLKVRCCAVLHAACCCCAVPLHGTTSTSQRNALLT